MQTLRIKGIIKSILVTGIFLHSALTGFAQQILWAKLFPLQKSDDIRSVARDPVSGRMFAGGQTMRKVYQQPGGDSYPLSMLITMDENGDTLGIKYFDWAGMIFCLALDPFGNLRVNIHTTNSQTEYPVSVRMTQDGVIYKVDSLHGYPLACTMGKDSSLIVVGYRGRTGFPGDYSMYFQRIQVDGSIDPFIELNPGHPDCRANRVEQLPNGKYLVSGYVGSRIASYELNEFGSSPIFKQHYQSIDFSNMSSGYVGRLGQSKWSVAGNGVPAVVGVYNSMDQKVWLRKQTGPLTPPQGMIDSSIVFGYNTSAHPIYRLGYDSSLVWYLNLKDSLAARGFPIGNVDLTSISNFEDQSAVVAGRINNGAVNSWDPIFLKIANVGTPVTSLLKPKKGPLANETLAPWPNPTGGTLYLKQHFDKAEIHLYNLAGKEMGEYRIGFGQRIDISGYESGVYLYRAVIDGKFYSGKVVKR